MPQPLLTLSRRHAQSTAIDPHQIGALDGQHFDLGQVLLEILVHKGYIAPNVSFNLCKPFLAVGIGSLASDQAQGIQLAVAGSIDLLAQPALCLAKPLPIRL